MTLEEFGKNRKKERAREEGGNEKMKATDSATEIENRIVKTRGDTRSTSAKREERMEKETIQGHICPAEVP